MGATVIATSSSDEKLQLARDAGAAETFNYKTHPDWDEEVLRLTSGRGVDHVLDVGGASTLMKSLRNARHGGHVSVLGILGPGDESGVTTELLMGAKSGMLSIPCTELFWRTRLEGEFQSYQEV